VIVVECQGIGDGDADLRTVSIVIDVAILGVVVKELHGCDEGGETVEGSNWFWRD
jgi:hypothetical protein